MKKVSSIPLGRLLSEPHGKEHPLCTSHFALSVKKHIHCCNRLNFH